MANSNEEPKKTSEIKQEHTMEQSTQFQPATNLSAPRNKSLLPAGALLIAIGALVTSVYTISLNQQLQNQLADKNNQLATQLERLTQEQAKAQEQIDAKITAKTKGIEEIRSSLQAKFDELNKQLQTAMSQRFYQNQNWQLLKARYYLELAQINAHWSKSVGATVAMLQQADQLLQQLNDPQIFDIRQAIAKDIAQLQALPKVDVAGILSELDAVQSSLNDLNIPSIANDETSETTTKSETTKGNIPVWRLHLQDSMNLLSKLVIIRRNDENIKPLISPAFEAILKENIRLDLQEAQWAVLNSNPQVYQLVLNQALTTLKKNFNQNTQNTAALMKKITELQQVQLTQKRPEIGSGLPLLNQLIEAKTPGANQTNTDGQGGTGQ